MGWSHLANRGPAARPTAYRLRPPVVLGWGAPSAVPAPCAGWLTLGLAISCALAHANLRVGSRVQGRGERMRILHLTAGIADWWPPGPRVPFQNDNPCPGRVQHAVTSVLALASECRFLPWVVVHAPVGWFFWGLGLCFPVARVRTWVCVLLKNCMLPKTGYLTCGAAAQPPCHSPLPRTALHPAGNRQADRRISRLAGIRMIGQAMIRHSAFFLVQRDIGGDGRSCLKNPVILVAEVSFCRGKIPQS